MNKKLTFLICLLAIFGLKLSAQNEINFGIFTGGSVNTMNIDKAFYYDDDRAVTVYNSLTEQVDTVYYNIVNGASIKPNGGFILGGLFEYKSSERFGLQFELLFNQYGYKLNGSIDEKNHSDNSFETYPYTSSLKISNFSAALLLKIYAFDFLSVDLGVQPSYCFRMIKEGKRGIEQFSTNYDNENYNALNFNATGGLTGYIGDFFVSARYTFGFTDILKVRKPYYEYVDEEHTVFSNIFSDAKSTTSSLQFTIGYRFN